ncbi:MAG: PepSY domain-containing protein [Candidatus Rariloculaceae bacterium]
MSTKGWRRWVYRPQALPLRRVLYQVHLWLGITVGLYVVVISVSGSAVVFRRELTRWLLPDGNIPNTGYPWALVILEWFVDLHDNLLSGSIGRDLNGGRGSFCCRNRFDGHFHMVARSATMEAEFNGSTDSGSTF